MKRHLCVLLVVVLAACASRPTLSHDETTLVAWWIEDTCRGISRSPGELQTENSSQGLQRIAESAAKPGTNDIFNHRLAARRARWPVVLHFLSSGVLVPAEDGLVTVATARAGSEEAALAHTIANDENHDRLTIEVLVLSKAHESTDATRRLRGVLRATRSEADRQKTPRP